jgi:hypothetical protein
MAFDPNEARDYHGRWAAGGDSGEIPAVADPRVAAVAGGDEWNRATAARLEAEYAAARPALNKIAEQAPTQETTANVSPQEWEDLASTTQSDAESHYSTNNFDSEYENEVNNWHENGEPQAIAAQDLQHDEDWKQEKLADYLTALQDNDKPGIPFSPEDLASAIQFTAAGVDEYQNGSTNVDPLIQFNKDALQHPTDLNPDTHNPDQMAIPGIEPRIVAPQDHLTQDMRDGLVAYFTKEFNAAVEKKSGDVETPDYLSENVKESLADAWAQMDDTEKFSWTKQNTSLIDDEPADNSPHTLELPAKFDPLNMTSGEDYTRTQAIAKYMADMRAVQIMTERGLGGERRFSWGAYNTPDLQKHMEAMTAKANEPGAKKSEAYMADIQNIKDELAKRAENEHLPASLADIQAVDDKLWSGWKGSSTGSEGLLLQVAAADELGGRSRTAPPQNTETTVTVGGMIVKAPTDKAVDDLLDAKTTLANEKSSVQEMKDALATVDNYVTTHGATSNYAAKDLALQTSFEWAKALIKENAWGGKYATLDQLDKAKGIIALYEKQALSSDNQKTIPNAPSVAYKEFAKGEAATGGTLSEFYNAIKEAKDPIAIATAVKFDKDMSFEQKAEAQKVLDETKGGTPMLKAEKIVVSTTPGRDSDFTLLPDLKLTRNGAASFTTDRDVANNWGGTSNYATKGINRDDVIAKANEEYKAIGGYEGVKAAIRAKWETTQFMLDKADIPSLTLYRGINMPHFTGKDSVGDFNPPSSGKVTLLNGGEVELSNALVGTQYHIASGKTITKVGEKDTAHTPYSQFGHWQYGEPERPTSRVVIRAEVPRTAALSVPAYGVNVHSEHEVVVTGTAWHHWDAFSERAPAADVIPIGGAKVASDAEKEQIRQRTVKAHQDYEDYKAGKITADQLVNQDIVAKYKAKIPKEQQL